MGWRWWVVAGALACVPARGEAAMASGLQAVAIPLEQGWNLSRTSPVEGDAHVELEVARGEQRAELLVVRAERDSLITANVTALTAANGDAIPASATQVDEVAFVSHADRELPDRVAPLDGPRLLRAGENLVLLVELDAPRATAPGHYRGTIALDDGARTTRVALEAAVISFKAPRAPSLATSLAPQAGDAALLARAALTDGVTLRTLEPPPFRVQSLEGTLQIDFAAFDRALTPLLADGARPTSIAIDVPDRVPLPRRLEYLLAVKRHLNERGCGELLVNFGEEGSLLERVNGNGEDVPGIALVGASERVPARATRWWRLDAATADGEIPLDALAIGAPAWRVRALGWAAFSAGARGLYSQRTSDLLYLDGTDVSSSLRLKILREALEDFARLQFVEHESPGTAKRLATEIAASQRAPDFTQTIIELNHLAQQRRPMRVSVR